MLRGRFDDTSGAAYIEGRLLFPRLNVRSNISFCVDTGADQTVLMPTDALRMRIDHSNLHEDAEPSVGIGGYSYNYAESAYVMFNERKKAIHVYQIEVVIVEPDAPSMELPSILGRDILNRWRMRYAPTSNRLTFDVVTSDFTIPIEA